MGERFYLVLADVVSSRKIEFREKLQKSIGDACQKVNSKYSQDVYADFRILKGADEFGGVLTNISNLFRILTILEDSIFPEKIRFAVVLDYIDVGLDSRDISKMDGPAFYKASEYISELRKTRLLLRLSIEDKIIDCALEGEINLMFMMRSRWTARQHEMANNYEELHTYVKVAEKFGISTQTVSLTLKRARWWSLYLIGKTLNEALLRYQERLSGHPNECDSINRNSTHRNRYI